ncbi:TPA: YopN family type III secretion system gatekeeper subunit, partial [Shigella sonnei]|nr:YopN family type III secretion system gatekeeper subunit [Shigella flexneri]EFZ4625737.1 YopN family type III secretion system gatekeeper subunit [Shigella sonnei]EGD7509974.1 YopN family type III secretion system gatekeeper subunit [Shigella sonnei]EGE0429102.1 YopN family type III secretion system gatekeeper subunit [Shigella sonnei]EGE1266339.1 YopN family type III secretion system gatekeeper subunit [Shigella sonnei]
PSESEQILTSVIEVSRASHEDSVVYQTYLSSVNESPHDIFKSESEREIAINILRELVTSAYKKELSR